MTALRSRGGCGPGYGQRPRSGLVLLTGTRLFGGRGPALAARGARALRRAGWRTRDGARALGRGRRAPGQPGRRRAGRRRAGRRRAGRRLAGRRRGAGGPAASRPPLDQRDSTSSKMGGPGVLAWLSACGKTTPTSPLGMSGRAEPESRTAAAVPTGTVACALRADQARSVRAAGASWVRAGA